MNRLDGPASAQFKGNGNTMLAQPLRRASPANLIAKPSSLTAGVIPLEAQFSNPIASLDSVEAWAAPCDTCHQLERPQGEFRLVLELCPDDLAGSALSGCNVCSILWRGLCSFVPDPSGDVRHISILGDTVDNSHPLLSMVVALNVGGSISLEFFTNLDSISPWPTFKNALRIPRDTASGTSLLWLTEAMARCCKEHKHCSRNKHRLMPTRLIEVNYGRGEYALKLVESRKMNVDYVCLSHCWGGLRHIMTTKNNIDLHRQNVSWDNLPRTFQDAIDFVRRLGLRYIWIDSLCIVQDSEADWATEAERMADIYRGSTLTIAATTAANDLRGCYTTNGQPDYALRTPEQPFDIYVRQPILHWDSSVPQEYLKAFPLLSRAWFYQERMMAPRIVHFSDHELVWECMTEVCCQCGLGDPSKVGLNSKMNRRDLYSETSEKERDADSSRFATGRDHRERMWKDWQQHVSDYSRLHLTCESDRLPALAGLARRIHSMRDSEYVGGMWLDSFLADLLWRADVLLPSRSPAQHMPTWSWASVHGVSFLPLKQKITNRHTGYATIIEASTVTVNEANLFGDICFGFIEVYGLAIQASAFWTLSPSRLYNREQYKVRMPFRSFAPYHYSDGIYLRFERFSASACADVYLEELSPVPKIPDIYTFYPDYQLCSQRQMINNDEVFCLRIGTMTFLILCRCQSRTTGFERIGVLDCGANPYTAEIDESEHAALWDELLRLSGEMRRMIIY